MMKLKTLLIGSQKLSSIFFFLIVISVIYSCGKKSSNDGAAVVDSSPDSTSDSTSDATNDATDNTPPIVLTESGIKITTVTATTGTVTTTATMVDPKQIVLDTDTRSVIRKGANDYIISYSNKMMELAFTADKATLTQLPITNLPDPGSLRLLDSASGKYYAAYEYYLNSVWTPYLYSISSSYAATKLVGNGSLGSADGSNGLTLPLTSIYNGVVIGGDLYFGNGVIRKMSLTSPYAVTTLAGTLNGPGGVTDGIGTAAQLESANIMLLATGNKIIFSDYRSIREYDVTTKAVKTIAGTLNSGGLPNAGHDNSTNPLTSTFNSITSMARSASGSIYLTENNYQYIRKVDYKNGAYGAVTTIAGNGSKNIADTVADSGKFHNALLASIYDSKSLFFEGDVLYFIDKSSVLRKMEFLSATP